MCGLCVVTILGLTYVNYKVIKIVKGKDIVLIMMLTSLKISLVTYAIFYGFNARHENKKVYDCGYYYSMYGCTGIWPAFSLGIALMFTFNKWVNYTMILFTVQKKLKI